MAPFKFRACPGAAAIAMAMAIVCPASAQTVGAFLDSPIPSTSNRGRNVSVTERERPELEAIGFPLSGFVLYTEVEAGAGYSDNVFSTAANRRSDGYAAIDPEFRLQSRWANHELRISGGAELRRFFNESVRNQSGLHLEVDGRYDISRDTNVTGFAQARRAYQNQFSSSVPDNAIQPTEFVQVTARARGQHRAGRWRAIAAADLNDFDFNDVVLSNGTRLEQDFRDRSVLRSAIRLEYAVNPDASVFGEANYSLIDHRDNLISGRQPNRDAREVRVLGGLSFDLSARVRAQAGVGFIRRGFRADNVYAPIADFAYDVRLEYFLSGLTTISVAAIRSIEESVITTSSGFVANTFELRADHELLRNFVLTAAAGYQANKFVGIDRMDEFISLRSEGTYMISREFGIRAGARYLDRASGGNVPGQTFNEWQGQISLVAQR